MTGQDDLTEATGRVTVPAELDAAVGAVFGERRELAERFAGHLVTSGVTRGLIGPREVDRVWERHVLNCGLAATLVPPGAHVVDVGSGAGLPGIAIVIARPDVEVTLVEPLQRRVGWLAEVIAELDLTGVHVVRARAEELVGKVSAQIVTARAVAPLGVLAGWCLPLLRPGGLMLAVKGRTAEEELARSERELRAAGASEWRLERCGEGLVPEPTTVVVVTAGGPGGSGNSARQRRSRAAERASDRREQGAAPSGDRGSGRGSERVSGAARGRGRGGRGSSSGDRRRSS